MTYTNKIKNNTKQDTSSVVKARTESYITVYNAMNEITDMKAAIKRMSPIELHTRFGFAYQDAHPLSYVTSFEAITEAFYKSSEMTAELEELFTLHCIDDIFGLSIIDNEYFKQLQTEKKIYGNSKDDVIVTKIDNIKLLAKGLESSDEEEQAQSEIALINEFNSIKRMLSSECFEYFDNDNFIETIEKMYLLSFSESEKKDIRKAINLLPF